MNEMTWHASPDVLATFASRPEVLDDPTASSVEQHLVACGDCRAVVASVGAPLPFAATWEAIADRIDRPRASVLERLLMGLGVADDSARLAGATGALQLAWLATVVVLAVGAVGVADAKDSAVFFLTVAPLLPLAATAMAFRPGIEPAGEAGVATPLHGSGAAIRRVVATVVPTVGVLLVLTPLLPDVSWRSVGWLLPSLALATASLFLATIFRMPVAIAVGAAGWVGALAAVRVAAGAGGRLEQSAVFGAAGQLVAIGVFAVALAGLVVRRDRFATMEVGW